MRRVLERDHDFLGEDAVPASDLVLGAPALLGIFFALAMICAVCFGFGYSSAHGMHLASHAAPAPAATPTASPASVTSPSDIENAGTAEDSAADDTQAGSSATAKPAPGVAADASQYWPSSDPQPGEHVPAEARPGSLAARSVPAPAPALAEAPSASATTPAAVSKVPAVAAPAAAEAAAAGNDAPPGTGLMVQIAAVTHAADANTLATALRHDGFAAIVRTTTGDPFFHVQVGPFPSLTAAKAMRARLADSGYNAFIKP